jgi:hypothetical protein
LRIRGIEMAGVGELFDGLFGLVFRIGFERLVRQLVRVERLLLLFVWFGFQVLQRGMP